jgi:hypothetical protein
MTRRVDERDPPFVHRATAGFGDDERAERRDGDAVRLE